MVSVAAVKRLPNTTTDAWDWQMQAACRNMDSAVFFHPDRERGSAKRRRDQRAKAVCRSCPVIEQCLRHALQVQEPYGVWGGLTSDERAAAHLRGAIATDDTRRRE